MGTGWRGPLLLRRVTPPAPQEQPDSKVRRRVKDQLRRVGEGPRSHQSSALTQPQGLGPENSPGASVEEPPSPPHPGGVQTLGSGFRARGQGFGLRLTWAAVGLGPLCDSRV